MPEVADEIITHKNDRHRHYPEASYRDFLAIYRAANGLGPLPSVPPLREMGDALEARIDLGRWLVECEICKAAVVADPDDPVFLCPSCGSGGKWRPVIFPADRAVIEEILLLRPGFRDANTSRFWLPGETAEQLAVENWSHDVPTPSAFKAAIDVEIARIKRIAEETAEVGGRD